MKQNRWPDYLFSVGVRLVFGGIFGAVGGLLLLVSGRHPMVVHLGGRNALMLIAAAFVLGAVIGSIGAVLTIPDWQTPWYKGVLGEKKDEDEPTD
ncbi:MAG: hypothetical protein JWQ04_1997 [Pedosphaera sp.]|nr:hypothetical protein [Pedosphaera sp.]